MGLGVQEPRRVKKSGSGRGQLDRGLGWAGDWHRQEPWMNRSLGWCNNLEGAGAWEGIGMVQEPTVESGKGTLEPGRGHKHRMGQESDRRH